MDLTSILRIAQHIGLKSHEKLQNIPASGTDLKSRKGLYWNRGVSLGFVGWENHGKIKGGDGLMK